MICTVSLFCCYQPNWKLEVFCQEKYFLKKLIEKIPNFIVYDITMGLTVLLHSLWCIISDSEACPCTSQSPRFSVQDSFLFFAFGNYLNITGVHLVIMFFNCVGVFSVQ